MFEYSITFGFTLFRFRKTAFCTSNSSFTCELYVDKGLLRSFPVVARSWNVSCEVQIRKKSRWLRCGAWNTWPRFHAKTCFASLVLQFHCALFYLLWTCRQFLLLEISSKTKGINSKRVSTMLISLKKQTSAWKEKVSMKTKLPANLELCANIENTTHFSIRRKKIEISNPKTRNGKKIQHRLTFIKSFKRCREN